MVRIQKDKLGGLPESFTVNVGIFIPDFYQIVWGKAKSTFASEADCPVRIRAGHLMQDDPYQVRHSTEVWWSLKSDIAFEDARKEISQALRMKILPFLESFNTIYDVRDFLEKSRGPKPMDVRLYLSIARHRTGDPEGAHAILKECAKGSWSQRCERVRLALG